ncbi:ornithine cyclodeaminase family protein [Cellulophaga sp. F20128]|uniref:ornithine cyclodeaminase family protein n=1 Tax=Cellulophaga sp. F20128 TaxID=2926413 RepID=UPI001FF41ED7|nr:ornithine cyclodeaminase family protein [Cellulophaga sp. F20128]MCK0155767.1 ornithine cyclodeaminase family protein [Cellulophaga sp. F20128]
MDNILQIPAHFIEQNTHFPSLIDALRTAFSEQDTLVPMRHHHDFPNPDVQEDSTLLLMPAWKPGKYAGVKIATVSPKNGQFNLPAIQGVYIYLDALKGGILALLEAKSLTAKRTAAASALASYYLSKENSSSLLMIGTGALASNLILAHASVRPLKTVYVWGRNYAKAVALCEQLKDASFQIKPIKTIEEKIAAVDIISTATLSKTPLVFGKHLQPGQHVDLVGAYKVDMREADDETVTKSEVYVDTFQGGLKESGDIVIPLKSGVLKQTDIKADLFELTSQKKKGRLHEKEITMFKSVGHALEDLAAASYYYSLLRTQRKV